MKMIIVNPFLAAAEDHIIRAGARRVIDGPAFIPRIGEKIKYFYNPDPVVEEVVYNFAEDTVTVTVR